MDLQKIPPIKPEYKWVGNPKIGWWSDRKTLLMYHGTNIKNLTGILETGIYAPKAGPTANWVSMAFEPNTSHGYASMGGESGFRAAGAKAASVPDNERVVFVCQFPMNYILKNMESTYSGNFDYTRARLIDKNNYVKWTKSDQEYYSLAELRFPRHIPEQYVLGYMRKVRH
jgi:hypothetical protein